MKGFVGLSSRRLLQRSGNISSWHRGGHAVRQFAAKGYQVKGRAVDESCSTAAAAGAAGDSNVPTVHSKHPSSHTAQTGLLLLPSPPLPSPIFFCAVNNVGTNIRKPSVEFSESDFSTIFSTNLESAFALSQQFHPLLKAAGSSVLLFNSSVAGEYMTLQAGSELSLLCRLGGPGLQCADKSAAGTMGAHGETAQHNACGRRSQTSALASKPRAHEGARRA